MFLYDDCFTGWPTSPTPPKPLVASTSMRLDFLLCLSCSTGPGMYLSCSLCALYDYNPSIIGDGGTEDLMKAEHKYCN